MKRLILIVLTVLIVYPLLGASACTDNLKIVWDGGWDAAESQREYWEEYAESKNEDISEEIVDEFDEGAEKYPFSFCIPVLRYSS
jgi:hypothetical protein